MVRNFLLLTERVGFELLLMFHVQRHTRQSAQQTPGISHHRPAGRTPPHFPAESDNPDGRRVLASIQQALDDIHLVAPARTQIIEFSDKLFRCRSAFS